MEKDFDLIICDTYGHFAKKSVGKFSSVKKRDEYIRDIAVKLEEAKKLLKKGKESGNAIVGADAFSFTSLGENVFGRDNTKRYLVWNKNKEVSKGYTKDLVFFAWAVGGKGWIYNLKEGLSFFKGEYFEDGEQYQDAESVCRDIVRTFSNEGGKVLVVTDHKGSIIKDVVESEKREYVQLDEVLEHGVK